MKREFVIIKNVTQHLYSKDLEAFEVKNPKDAKDVKINPTVIASMNGEVKTIHPEGGKLVHTQHDKIEEAKQFLVTTLGINNMIVFDHGNATEVEKQKV